MNVNELVQKLEKLDGNTRDKIARAKSPEESYKIAKTVGFAGSFEEFSAKMQSIHDEYMDISESDLKLITGKLNLEDAPEGPDGTLSTLFVAALAAM